MKRKSPSVIGCAFGFGAAGSGVGSVVGVIVGRLVWMAMPDADRAQTSGMSVLYRHMDPGIVSGFAFGAFVGICYAVTVRWRRSRRSPLVES